MNNLHQAIKDFLQHCRYEKNLSEKTSYFYQIDLLQFSAFMLQNDYPDMIDQIGKAHFKHYLKEISLWKIKTVKRKIATLKALFNYLEYEELIISNPLRKLRISLKEPNLLPKALSKVESIAIFNYAYKVLSLSKTHYNYLENLRNVVVIELLFSSGGRVSEISNLKSDDINNKTGTLLLKGKGNKERIIQICNTDTLSILETYQSLFSEKINLSNGYFLVNRLNKKLSDQSIRNLVHSISTAAKINKKVTPHVFRHTFATLLLENEVDIKYIQSLLGHSSIMTTQIYTQVNKEKQKQILQSKHPRMEFSINGI